MPEPSFLEPCRPGCTRPATYLHLTHAPEGTAIALRCGDHRIPDGHGLDTHHAPAGFTSAVRHVPGQSGLFDNPTTTAGGR